MNRNRNWNINPRIMELAEQVDCLIDGMGYGEGIWRTLPTDRP